MSNVGPLFPWSNQPLAECDPDVADLIEREKNRQWRGLELIASEVRLMLLHEGRDATCPAMTSEPGCAHQQQSRALGQSQLGVS
jgi:hypothetical protein